MHILSIKKLFVLCSVVNMEVIFEINIVISFPSYLLFLLSPFDISCIILISKSKSWAANELAKQKKVINYHIKGLYKATCYKTKSIFS